MHELSLANAILTAVRSEAAQRPGLCVRTVGVRVGELAGVDPDALSFCFEALVRGTDLEPLRLAIEPCPRRQRCSHCGHSFTVVDCSVACPACGELRTECIGGEELELAYLEVEEP